MTHRPPKTIAVLNEAGEGNVALYAGLTSNIAALQVMYAHDREFTAALRALIDAETTTLPPTDDLGNVIAEEASIHPTAYVRNSIVMGRAVIGPHVICENSFVVNATVTHAARINHCFVGERAVLGNGFSAESSLFFANCDMGNGEACAAFCGPFTASHHKSSLLIGGEYSFYNAGSGTNYSNHAYKMGALHHGTIERGGKTASGAHIIWPARIGAFSMCMGKIANHPNTAALPFSYVIGNGQQTTIVPGKVLATAGLFRDVSKWPKRDRREPSERRSLITYSWLNPYTVSEIVSGLAQLNAIAPTSSDYRLNNCLLSEKHRQQGILLYTLAIEMFLNNCGNTAADIANEQAAITNGQTNVINEQTAVINEQTAVDLGGLIVPLSAVEALVDDIRSGRIMALRQVEEQLTALHRSYPDYCTSYAQHLMAQGFRPRAAARNEWLNLIRQDAEREFALGDVDRSTLDSFLQLLDNEQTAAI